MLHIFYILCYTLVLYFSLTAKQLHIMEQPKDVSKLEVLPHLCLKLARYPQLSRNTTKLGWLNKIKNILIFFY